MTVLAIQSVLETCLYVDDLIAAKAFYGDILGLKLFHEEAGKFVFFKLGHGMLLIFNPEASMGGAHDLPDHGAHGIEHVAFQVDESDLDAWKSRLESLGVEIESDHIWPHGRRSIYFRDPAGHSIELAPAALWQS